MALENKLGITDSAELAREEEMRSKKKAIWLFEEGILDTLDAGSLATLKEIHKILFGEIYEFAGEIRKSGERKCQICTVDVSGGCACQYRKNATVRL